jgi:hypothetical protein
MSHRRRTRLVAPSEDAREVVPGPEGNDPDVRLGGGVDLAVAHEFLERLQDPRDGAVAAARQDANLVVLRVPLRVPRPTGRRRRPRRTRLRG